MVPNKTETFLAPAKKRAALERELITRLGDGEAAWNKMFSLPDELLDSAAKSLDGSIASIEQAATIVLRECQFEELYGAKSDDCNP